MITESDLLFWYDINEGSGATLDNAEGTVTYDGDIISSPPWVTGGPTNLPNAIDLDGAADYIETNLPSTTLGTGDFSFILWIKFDDTSTLQQIFSDWGGTRSTLCRIFSNNLEFYTGDGSGTLSGNASLAFSDTTNYAMVAFVYEASTKTQKISVNAGSFSTTVHSGTKGTSSNEFKIGTRPDAVSEFVNGRIAQAICLSKAVDLTELGQLYNSGDGETYTSFFSTEPTATPFSQASVII